MIPHAKHILTKNITTIRRAYFDEIVKPAFDTVTQSIPPIVNNYTIAGKTISLFFYSETLFKTFSRALSHLETHAEQSPDLTVHLWDSASTGVFMDSPFDHTSHESFTETNSGKQLSDQFLGIFLEGEQTLNLYDLEAKTAYFWARDANLLPDWLHAAPIRPILHWFLSRSNVHLVHGAVIGLQDQAILLSAKGGSGKSTTAISSVLAQMNYLGDDYVGIEAGEKIIAHSIYNSAKVDDKTMARFPHFKKHIANPNHKPADKSIIYFSEIFPDQLKQSASLSAILIPRITENGITRIIPATKLQAMLALSPTTLFQLPLAGNHQLGQLKQIIEKTPCHILELGKPIEDVPNILTSFLKQSS